MKADYHIEINHEVLERLGDEAKKRMLMATNELRNTILEMLSGNRTGRIYKVPGTKRFYTASSPGEPPAQQTGTLRQSIHSSVEGEKTHCTGIVGTDLDYGAMLEYGTKKMAPRPWLAPSIDKAKDEIMKILSEEW